MASSNSTGNEDMSNSLNTCSLEDGEEEDIYVSRSNAADSKFDLIIGNIEDIIMEEKFQNFQTEFLEKYYREFDDGDENKLIYTDIHEEYTRLVEKLLDDELHRSMPDFDMDEFQNELILRKEEMEGEIFEVLLTFTDFLAFKEMVLEYKADKEGRGLDLSDGIKVIQLSTPRAPLGDQGSRGDHLNNGAPCHLGGDEVPDDYDSDDDDDSGPVGGKDLNFLVVGNAIRPPKH